MIESGVKQHLSNQSLIASHLAVFPFQALTFPITHFESAQESLCPYSSAPLAVINRLRNFYLTSIIHNSNLQRMATEGQARKAPPPFHLINARNSCNQPKLVQDILRFEIPEPHYAKSWMRYIRIKEQSTLTLVPKKPPRVELVMITYLHEKYRKLDR